MNFASVCSGIEAASVAWAPLGWRAVLVSEIEGFPRRVLAHRHGAWDARRAPGMGHNGGPALWGDFTTIRPRHLRRLGIRHAIDLLVGGTPCQSFSVAGLRGGLDDARGNLALEYLRLARRLRPRWLVWENVPGVLSSNGGRDFGAILGGMVQLGYGVAYRVLDAQYTGVPQRRRRVFVVGHLGDWRAAAAVLFERHSLQRHSAPRREAGEGPSGTLAGGARRSGGYSADDVPLTAATLDASFGRLQGCAGQDANHGHSHPVAIPFDTAQITSPVNGSMPRAGDACHPLAAAGHPPSIAFGGNRTSGAIDVAPALNAHGGGSRRMDFESEALVCAPALTSNPYGDHEGREGLLVTHALRGEGFDGSEDGTGRGIPLVPTANALTAHWAESGGATAGNNPGLSNPILYPHGVRRLTPTECERLQGFPDGYTRIPIRKVKAPKITAKRPADMWERINGEWWLMAADGPRYKALGNSMAIPPMRWIGERIAAVEALKATREAAE